MNVRRLVPADAPAYRALMLAAYARHPDAFTSSPAERAALPLAWWEARVAEAPDAHERVVGAWADDTLAGVAGLSFETRAKARHKATLFGMYVLPAFRHEGVGARLVDAVLAAARARDGVGLVQLTVSAGNRAAQALYARAGFVPFGVEPFAVAVDDGFVAKVHMWCDLGLGAAHPAHLQPPAA
jgi:ribosomal protein S18 acetylase RimI-like enzyme